MSLRKQHKEIQRLIAIFESEAAKFHNIKFSTYIISSHSAVEDIKFEKKNHTIMLWQYYGKFSRNKSDIFADQLIENLKSSDLKWGIRGAQLTSFGVIEGDNYDLFIRMAKRAGNLFNAKETKIIKTAMLDEILETEKAVDSVTAIATNDNSLAIWLNYLLYYISMTHPGNEKKTIIEPDLFTLSLLALEQILQDDRVEKQTKQTKGLTDIKFKVALSFPGEKRNYVSVVADQLINTLGNDSVFYDNNYQSQLARINLDLVLQNIYRNNSDLIVVFICSDYALSEWCGLELRAIRDMIKSGVNEKIMLVRFDQANIDGFFSIDGYIDANEVSEIALSKLIIERLESIKKM